jgi:small subunit ribosomal protein S6
LGPKKIGLPNSKKIVRFYHLIQFQAPGNFIADLEINFKRDERIIRFLTVALDKHSLAWAEKRRAKKTETKEVTA